MANDILITPGSAKINFSGATSGSISLDVLDTGTVAFNGTNGQLFSISDNMDGTIFSVNDISGIPSIEVIDDGTVKIAEYDGNVLVGTGTDNGTDKLQVNGSAKVGTELKINDIVLKESTDRADLLEITSNTSDWGGLQIRTSANEGRWSFMTDGETAGIYNDEDDKWHILMTEAGATEIRHGSDGTTKLATSTTGVTVTGTATATSFVKSGGTSAQFLKADGSVDSNAYLTTQYTHPTTSGNKHIPSGGSSGQILKWSADGTADWGSDTAIISGAGLATNGSYIVPNQIVLANTNIYNGVNPYLNIYMSGTTAYLKNTSSITLTINSGYQLWTTVSGYTSGTVNTTLAPNQSKALVGLSVTTLDHALLTSEVKLYYSSYLTSASSLADATIKLGDALSTVAATKQATLGVGRQGQLATYDYLTNTWQAANPVGQPIKYTSIKTGSAYTKAMSYDGTLFGGGGIDLSMAQVGDRIVINGNICTVTQLYSSSVVRIDYSYGSQTNLPFVLYRPSVIAFGEGDGTTYLASNGTYKATGMISAYMKQTDPTNRTFSTSWAVGTTWNNFVKPANSIIHFASTIPMRNDSTSWGGAYTRVEYSIDNGTTWISLGDTGYDTVMEYGQSINHWNGCQIINKADIVASTQVRFRFQHRSYDGTLTIRGSNGITDGVGYAFGDPQITLMAIAI